MTLFHMLGQETIGVEFLSTEWACSGSILVRDRLWKLIWIPWWETPVPTTCSGSSSGRSRWIEVQNHGLESPQLVRVRSSCFFRAETFFLDPLVVFVVVVVGGMKVGDVHAEEVASRKRAGTAGAVEWFGRTVFGQVK